MRTGRPFLRLLKGRHGLLSQEQFERLEQLDPDTRVPLRLSLTLLEAAVARTGDADLGLRAAFETERGEHDLIEFVAASSATYREALSLIRRYIRLVNDSLDLSFEYRDGRGIAQLESSVPLGRTATDFVVATFYLGFVRRTPPELQEMWKEVWFTHEEPADTRLYARVFGSSRICFSAPLDGVVFDERVLDCPTPDADSKLHELLRRLAEERLAELPPAEALTQRVRVLVSQQLGGGNPSAEQVAQLLSMSRRTLTRRLEQEGTTFKAIVDDLRLGLAQRYLAIENLGVHEIAALLGFSDSAAFHRAFRRWCGQTPSDYRREHRFEAARRDSK